MLNLSLSEPGKDCEETADGNEAYAQGGLSKRKDAAENHKEAEDDQKDAHISPCCR